MSISTRLNCSFLTVAFITLVVGVVGVLSLRHTMADLQDVGQVRLPGVQHLLVVRSQLAVLEMSLRTLLIPGLSPEEHDYEMERVAGAREKYRKSWDIYAPLPKTEEEAKNWAELQSVWQKYIEANNAFMAMIKAMDDSQITDPIGFKFMVQTFQADHERVRLQVHELLYDQDQFDGGDDHTVCRLGKWLATTNSANPEVKAAVDVLREPHRKYHAAVAQIKQLTQQDKKAEAIRILRDEFEPNCNAATLALQRMTKESERVGDLWHQAQQQQLHACNEVGKQARALLDQLVDINTNSAEESYQAGHQAATLGTIISLSVLAGGVVLAIVLGVYSSRSLTRPIRGMVDRLKDIAEGEGDLTQRVDESRKDELGELGRWFNTFVKKIHDTVAQVASAVHEVAGAATEIAASSEQMSRNLEEQKAQTGQVSSAVEEMSCSVVEVARRSTEAAGNAESAGKQATDGGEVVRQTIDGMNAIAAVVRESATTVDELGKRGEQIGQIIEVINDIADQTNLLALNAAIEAARAGEHGRGFAVVADEVRKLAERTTQATEEVAASIQAIQGETASAVQKMNEGNSKVTTGVELAEQAGQALGSIVDGARNVASMIQSIAAAAEEQSAAAEQISRSIEQINHTSAQSAEGAGQSATAATQLSAMSERLRVLVGGFKLQGSARG